MQKCKCVTKPKNPCVLWDSSQKLTLKHKYPDSMQFLIKHEFLNIQQDLINWQYSEETS